MPTYWMSTRLADPKGEQDNYQTRWKALQAVVRNHSSQRWEESTSFHLFTSSCAIDHLATAVKKAIDPKRDVVVIRYLDHATARFVGAIDDHPALLELVPYGKRV